MKKLMIAAVVFLILPIYSMNLVKITEKDIQSFAQHLSMAVKYSSDTVTKGEICKNNAIYIMLSCLDFEVQRKSNNILNVIQLEDGLKDRIDNFINDDSNELAQFALKQIKEKAADVGAAKAFLIRIRQLSAGCKFLKKQPTYSNAWINEVNSEDRVEFMRRNKDYPLDFDSQKDYWSLFIYQSLIAPIVVD